MYLISKLGIDVTPVKRTFPAKVIADCTEAMIGASYILEQLGTNPDSMEDNDYGNFTELSSKEVVSLRSALTMMMKFNVAADISSAIESILAGNYTAVNEQNKLALNENQLALVTALEKDLGYVFVTKRLALEAITHPSYRVDYSGSYQRLEFLGDAVLDFFNLRYLYFKNRDANPGLLTEYKHASVNNQAFSYVCVKNKLHKHMRVVNGDLVRAIREFEEACQNSPSVHDIDTPAPKPLGDIFEAIAGNIFNLVREAIVLNFSKFRSYFCRPEIPVRKGLGCLQKVFTSVLDERNHRKQARHANQSLVQLDLAVHETEQWLREDQIECRRSRQE
jgi:dsRNA-specific ribonuclease